MGYNSKYSGEQVERMLERQFIVNTLDSAPTESTLSWNDNGLITSYKIGDMVRCADSSSETGYSFYQLKDITTENAAIWRKIGSGGEVDLREKVFISLVSNQSQQDASLIGASVIVYDITNQQTIIDTTWNGEQIVCSVTPMSEYRVTVGDVDGYTTPSEQSYTSQIQYTRNVSMSYECSVVTVYLDSNQSDKSDISDAYSTVKYGSVEKIVNNGESIKIPIGVTYTVSASNVEKYKTPSDASITAETTSKDVTMIYNTCVLSVSVSGFEDSSISVSATVSYGGNPYTLDLASSMKIPYGESVTVSMPDVDMYITPSPVSFTTSEPSKSVTMAYVYNPIYISYITIDQTITDPASMITGDINGTAIQKIRENTHRVLGKYTSSGKMTVCRLSDTDSTKYYDGTAASLTGSEGDVFMQLPTFYTKSEQTSTDVWKIGFAIGGQPDSSWKEWGGNDLIGVYEAYYSSSKVYSRSGVTPTVSVSQADFKTYARNRGTGYTIVKHRHQNIMAFLFYAMYGHTNSQLKVGLGTSSYPKTTGQTNALGMTDTVGNGGNGDSQSINFWGLENWWGDLYEWEDNVVVNPSSANGVWRITEDNGSMRNVAGALLDGYYVKKMIIGQYLDTITSSTDTSGSATTGYCDYQYIGSSSTFRVVLRSVGGSDTSGGVVSAYAYYDSSVTHSGSGSRLAFTGEITEAESVSAFKSISVTN